MEQGFRKIKQKLNPFIDSSLPTDSLFNVSPNGVTPPINGESFSIKRGYQFRPSTIRKLHELKSKHPDINTYLNTILDESILHFYNYIMNENGSFSSGEI